ncbi:hypothetical protein HZB02_06595 [Candidatus Woesearchaeota archaeon]|nr:hypothetical protein [Candidatus Woesearchaeota archaeon]
MFTYLKEIDPHFPCTGDDLYAIDWQQFKAYLQEQQNPLESVEATLVMGDQPLLMREEVRQLRIRQHDDSYDGIWPWIERCTLDSVLAYAHITNLDHYAAKMNFFPTKDKQGTEKEVRFSGVFVGRGLEKFDRFALDLLTTSYDNRELITTSAMSKIQRWYDIVTYAVRSTSHLQRAKGITKREARHQRNDALLTLAAMAIPRLFQAIGKKPVDYTSSQSIERNMGNLIGFSPEIIFPRMIGPLFDIDNPYCLAFVDQHFQELRTAQESLLKAGF